MREGESFEVRRARATRRFDGDGVLAPQSAVEPIWDPEERLQPLVIVVDDSPAVRAVVSIALNRQGIATLAFPGGLELLKALRDGVVSPPKLLLLDIGMPRLDGYQIAQRLRSNPGFKDTKISMLSGHDGVWDRTKSKVMGLGFIAKPFNSGKLIAIVRQLLGVSQNEEQWG
ncbi:MAG TPA: response regulator [Ktedonobacterales bacterium]